MPWFLNVLVSECFWCGTGFVKRSLCSVVFVFAGINPDELSPRDALERIFELHDLLRGKRGMMEE